MAVGGRLFDATGSYETAFLVGSAINAVQLFIVSVLLVRVRPAARLAAAERSRRRWPLGPKGDYHAVARPGPPSRRRLGCGH